MVHVRARPACPRRGRARPAPPCQATRPTPPGGFDIVRNGSAILATDFDGAPIGTYATVGAALQAWRERRGVVSRIT